MSTRLEVGGETKAFCTSCKAMQDHVIVALVAGKPAKVECDVCHKQHVYRAGPPGAAKSAAKSGSGKTASAGRAAKTRAAAPAETVDIAALLAGRVSRPYDPKLRFAVGEVVKHPSFGVGLVSQLPGPQKLEITFPDGVRLLTHDRAAAAPMTLTPPPRRGDEERGAADAPPSRRKV